MTNFTKRQTPQERAAKIEALQTGLVDQVASLTTSEDWTAMLATAARFHKYSPSNVFLIMMQMQMRNCEATRVAGFRTWLSLGRHVRKGEKGIAILAPCRYMIEEENGDKVPVLKGFKIEHVFDIAQTDGDDIADVRPVLLSGDAPKIWAALVTQCTAEGYEVRRGPCSTPTANGSTDLLTHTVTVRDDLAQAQATKTLIHELAHIRCGHVDNMSEYTMHRGTCEVEAESVSYVVGAALGWNTSDYSLPYVATWAAGDIDKVRMTADKVIRVAHDILAALEPPETQDGLTEAM